MSFTKAQLEHLEKRLHEERTRLTAQLHAFEEVERSENSQEQDGDLSKVPSHPADLGTDSINEALGVSIGTRVSHELAEIDAAMDRIINTPEAFGIDEDTGEPIPFERLDVIPYARVNVGKAP